MQNLIGQTLGQYKIIGLVGEGGMAAVYRSRQESMNRDVAIKAIKTNLIDMEDFHQRFEREAQMVASLSHAHILKVFDYGRYQDIVYLVMELLTGGSLDSLIKKGPMPVAQTWKILDQIGGALDYAHQKGIIHRDLKPENVLLDEAGNAFLTDFGLAKLLNSDLRLTQSGAAIGTPAYMSPEQWRGLPLDARTDVYSLGVLLYEMLTGTLPFKGDSALSMMYLHMHEAPPPLQTLRPELPPAVQAVIAKALAKQPEDRYQSAGQLVADFRAAAARRPSRQMSVVKQEQTPANEASKEPAKEKAKATSWFWALLAVGIIAAVVLAVAALSRDRVPVPTVAQLAAAESPTVNQQSNQQSPTAQPATAEATATENVQTQVAQVLAERDTKTAIAVSSFTATPTSTRTPTPTVTPMPTATTVPTVFIVPASATPPPPTQGGGGGGQPSGQDQGPSSNNAPRTLRGHTAEVYTVVF
jgi:serine/threonine protein kinase